MRRAVLVGVLAVVLAATGLTAPAQAVVTQVQVTRTSGLPTSGVPLALTVKVPNGLTGQKVWLERKVPGKWVAVAKRTLPASKQVTLSSPLRLGVQKFRVHVFAKGNRKAAFRGMTLVGRPRVSPAPYVNESFSVGGRLPKNGARPVKLQKRTGTTWTTLATKSANAAGSVAFARPGASTAATYRLFAPKKGAKAAFTSAAVTVTPAQRNTLISTTPGGHDGNGGSLHVDISGDGRFVVFETAASDLGPTDSNGTSDVYLRDRVARKTVLVSRGVGGAQANGASHGPVISDNGRYVVYDSEASNLVGTDANGAIEDVFRYDRTTGTTLLISHDGNGGGANGDSESPSVSANGQRIAFSSGATDLLAITPDDNSSGDVFLWSQENNQHRRISKPANDATNGGGGNFPAISADGNWVAFQSGKDDLVGGSSTTAIFNAFLRNVAAGTTALVSTSSCPSGLSSPIGVSNGGTYVAYFSTCEDVLPGDTLDHSDMFLRKMSGGAPTLISHKLGGGFSNGSSFGAGDITANGARVTFSSTATDLVASDGNGAIEDVFVWTRSSGVIALVSQSRGAGGPSNGVGDVPRISDSGRFVGWVSLGQNHLPVGVDTDTESDIYVRDLR